jgi:hypothetical protein
VNYNHLPEAIFCLVPILQKNTVFYGYNLLSLLLTQKRIKYLFYSYLGNIVSIIEADTCNIIGKNASWLVKL